MNSPSDHYLIRRHYSRPAGAKISCFFTLPGLLIPNVYATNTDTDTSMSTSNSTLPIGIFPVPTTPPLPPLKEPAKNLNEELSIAVAYAIQIPNCNATALCKAINTASLSKFPFINGTAVKTEVCNAAKPRVGKRHNQPKPAMGQISCHGRLRCRRSRRIRRLNRLEKLVQQNRSRCD